MSNASRCNFSAPPTAHCAYDFAQVDVFAENPSKATLSPSSPMRAASRPRRCRPSPARPTSAKPPSSFPAPPRSSANTASRSASSPCSEELEFAGHPPSAPQAGSICHHPIFRGAETDHPRSPRRTHPSPLHSAPGVRTRRLRHHATERPHLRRHRTTAARSRSIAAALGLSSDDLDPDLPSRPSPPACHSASCRCDRSKSPRACAIPPADRPQAYLDRSDSKFFHCITRAAAELRSRLARAHAIRHRRRSRYRFGIGLRHLLPRASWSSRQRSTHHHRTGNRDASSQPHSRQRNTRRWQRQKSVRRRSHYSCCKRTLFPAVMHAISTGTHRESSMNSGRFTQRWMRKP